MKFTDVDDTPERRAEQRAREMREVEETVTGARRVAPGHHSMAARHEERLRHLAQCGRELGLND